MRPDAAATAGKFVAAFDTPVPQYQSRVYGYGQPGFFSEIALMLWLALKGARPPALAASASPPAVPTGNFH